MLYTLSRRQSPVTATHGIKVAAGVLLAACVISLPRHAFAEQAPYLENQVKAVFLYNFARFIKWPRRAFSGPTSAFHFCTTKPGEVSEVLGQVIKGESTHGRPFKLQYVADLDQMRDCQVVYLPHSELSSTPKLLEATKGLSVLTVSDAEDFVDRGGMINLAKKKGRIHPVINTAQLSQAGLKASAKLLGLATLITP